MARFFFAPPQSKRRLTYILHLEKSRGRSALMPAILTGSKNIVLDRSAICWSRTSHMSMSDETGHTTEEGSRDRGGLYHEDEALEEQITEYLACGASTGHRQAEANCLASDGRRYHRLSATVPLTALRSRGKLGRN